MARSTDSSATALAGTCCPMPNQQPKGRHGERRGRQADRDGLVVCRGCLAAVLRGWFPWLGRCQPPWVAPAAMAGLAGGWRQQQVATYQFETTASNEASENWLIRC